MGKIGIAISTRNRQEAYETTLHHICKYLPPDSVLITVDDASDSPVPSAFRFDKQVGISTVKNKCIELLIQAECDHLFLFDNDTYPKQKGWHLPYVNSPYDHLCYSFLPNVTRSPKGHKLHDLGNGCMLYMSRKCIDTIGGFDTELYNKFEHVEYSRRAYNAGLIPHPFIDIVGSGDLIHSMDEHNEVDRTLTDIEALMLAGKNSAAFYKKMYDKNFKSYF